METADPDPDSKIVTEDVTISKSLEIIRTMSVISNTPVNNTVMPEIEPENDPSDDLDKKTGVSEDLHADNKIVDDQSCSKIDYQPYIERKLVAKFYKSRLFLPGWFEKQLFLGIQIILPFFDFGTDYANSGHWIVIF